MEVYFILTAVYLLKNDMLLCHLILTITAFNYLHYECIAFLELVISLCFHHSVLVLIFHLKSCNI